MDSTAIRKTTIREISLFFTMSFFIAVPFAILSTGQSAVFRDWLRILASPCPLVTDYYMLGSLPAAFLNAGFCSLACTALIFYADRGQFRGGHWAGFFLVAAHCFYGLNLLNMWPTIIGIFLYCKVSGRRFRNHIDMAMLSTAFGPFMSELMFRYPLPLKLTLGIGGYSINVVGMILALCLGIFLGFAIPAMLPGTKRLHKGLTLYNAGLAFGLLGLLIFSFMYGTLGVQNPVSTTAGVVADDHFVFCNVFFGSVFLICVLRGWQLNGRSFKGYGDLMRSSGHGVDFLISFDHSLTWMNLGLYGLLMVIYFDLVILLTDGAGWTGATCGVTLAAVSFAASGQHPRNVWPILMGYVLLNALAGLIINITGGSTIWTLSAQGYINGVAFATGLCPFSGVYGVWAGIAAGAINAVLCISTSQIHGGLVLYNGGLTSGLTAVILLPLLVHYGRDKS